MHCPHCGETVDATDAHCRHCGGALSADAGALDKLVEAKARAVLADERAREERLRADDAARAAEEREATRLRDARAQLDAARTTRERFRGAPPPRWRFTLPTALLALLIAVMFTVPVWSIGESVAGRPLWGSTLCPTVCADCRGPGRVFAWTSTVNGSRSDHSRVLCHNRHVDIDAMNYIPLLDPNAYADVELSWWKRVLPTLAVVLALGLLVLPALGAALIRGSQRRQARELDKRIEALERVAGNAPVVPSHQHYR